MEQVTGHKLQMGTGWTEQVRLSRSIKVDGSVEYRLMSKGRTSKPYEKRRHCFEAFKNDTISWEF